MPPPPRRTADPGNLEACVTAGATAGYSLLWVLALATAAGGGVQILAIRLGVGGGADLAALASAAYGSRPASALLWASTQLAIVGADIQALAGCAVALSGLSGGAVPPAVGVGLAAAASLGVLAATTHAKHGGVRLLEACFGVLVGALGLSLAALAAVAPVDWAGGVWRGLTTPRLSPRDAPSAAAIVGSVIMSHNLFLHSACVQSRRAAPPAEEEEGMHEEGGGGGGGGGARPRPPPPPSSLSVQRAAARYFSIEAGASLAVAGAICTACVAVFATGRTGPPATRLPPGGVQLAGAGGWLASRFGPPVAAVWGVGVLAAGQSAAMAGAYAAQHVAAGFGPRVLGAWRARRAGRGADEAEGEGGLPAHPWAPTPRLALAARAAAVIPALLIACLPTSSGSASAGPPSSPLDAATQALNVVQALQLPFALIPLIRLAASPRAAGALAVGAAGTAGAVAIAAAVLACNAGVALSVGGAVAAAAGVPGAAALAALYLAGLAWLALAPFDGPAIAAARAAAAAASEEAVAAAAATARSRGGGGGGRGLAEALL